MVNWGYLDTFKKISITLNIVLYYISNITLFYFLIETACISCGTS